jgi:hypothetical protein
MTTSKQIIINNPAILHHATEILSKNWLKYKQLGTPLELLIRPKRQTRSILQNALLHAVLTDIAKQVKWHGQSFDVVTWKRLCMAAWLREKNEQPQLIPALDGKGFDIIFERTSSLNVKDCADFCTWCLAFGDEHNVKFRQREIN